MGQARAMEMKPGTSTAVTGNNSRGLSSRAYGLKSPK